jgi:tRNA threonylcarbamoyladenosine biosynthesis protein TsaE
MQQIIIKDIADLDRAAEEFLPPLAEHRIFAFYGGMGSGKTTFISALCRRMGVTDDIASPTFAIVNEYHVPQTSNSPIVKWSNSVVYHFDFYRIKSLAEAYDIGIEDYFYSGSPCFIEWPELIEPLLPEQTVAVHITVNDDQSRTLKINN